MKLKLVFFIFLFACNDLSGQLYLADWDFGLGYTQIAEQVFWENGKLKWEDRREGENLFRFQYDPSGKLQVKAEIVRQFFTDTIITFDPETYEENIQIAKGYSDIADGQYVEYHTNAQVATAGQLKKHVQLGHWISYYPNGKVKEELSYNERGHLHGNYQSYFENGKKKAIGKYEAIFPSPAVEKISGENFQGEFIPEVQEKSFKSGRWKYYSAEGLLESTGKYKVVQQWEEEESFSPTTYEKRLLRRLVSKEVKFGKWKYYTASGKKTIKVLEQ